MSYGDGCGFPSGRRGGDASFVEERIARLMRPLETEPPQANESALWVLALAVGMVLVGTEFGERVVGTFLTIV